MATTRARKRSLFVSAMSKAAGLWMTAASLGAALLAACNGSQAPEAKPVPPAEKTATGAAPSASEPSQVTSAPSATTAATAKPGDPSADERATADASVTATATLTVKPPVPRPPMVTKYGGPPPPPIARPKYGGVSTKYGGPDY